MILSYFAYQEKKYLGQLFPKSAGDDIRQKLAEMMLGLKEIKQRDESLHKALRDFNLECLGHIQKVETLRYNPYNDTGGDQILV